MVKEKETNQVQVQKESGAKLFSFGFVCGILTGFIWFAGAQTNYEEKKKKLDLKYDPNKEKTTTTTTTNSYDNRYGYRNF